MTQLPQDEFETCLEKAEAWMKEIHERLKENDNTQGPRSALECRLRETEKICALEPDGKLLLDLVLTKAENILGESSDDEKHEIHVRLGKIKAMFEETTIYMTHCHSRIEWVWLHWNEYLRTRDEFMAWVHDMTLMLEPDMELQLGRKEKCWQFEQSQVLLRDVNNHSKLLDRLLEEASSLYNRIGDPSVDESVQSAMVKEYKQIKKKTQERTKCLEKIWRDHEAYEKEVNLFKSWLNSVIEKLKCCVGSASESTEIRLNMLQEIGKDVEIGKQQLVHLEKKSAEVIKDTSPLGAEKICRELEELRRTLDELKVMNDEEEEGLQKTYNSDNAFAQLAVQLEGNINEFRKAVQRLEESLESGEKVKSEDELIALRKTLIATKSSLAALEAIAERVKVQLKDLFKFSKDIQPLSDSVIAAMREYQRAKSKAFKLSTDTEFELQQLFQNPLRDFLYWKPITESVLDATAVAADNGTAYPDALDRIEKLLEESSTIKDNLAALGAKKDRIHSVLGDEGTELLLRNVTAAESEREALYRDLLERRGQILSLAIQSEEFDSALKLLHKKLSALRTKCAKENEKQPDINGKEAQLQRLQTLLDQLTKLHAPIKELNSKMEASPNHAHRASKLLSDYLALQRSLENNTRKTKEFINCHWMFNNDLLDLQRWMMETRQNVEAYLDGSGAWEEQEVEALLVEVSGKDIQRHRVEAQGLLVIESSSPEGAALINTELKQLLESWESLRSLCEQLYRSLKQRTRPSRSPTAVTVHQTSNFLSDGESMDGESQSPPQSPAETANPGKQDALQISGRYDDGHNGNAEVDGGGFSDYSTFISAPGEELDNSTAYHKRSPESQHTERSDSTDYEILRPAKDSDGQKRSGPARPASSISTDIEGYSSSSSSMADNDDTITTRKGTQTGHTGNLDSNGNESNRGNISGKANASISVTEGESAHNTDSSGNGNGSNRGNISGKANASISVTEVESAHKGDSSSNSNESNRGNISGKANSSISTTEVESAHKGDKAHEGARSKITSPAHGSGSSDKSVMTSTEMNKNNGKSRIPRPAGTSGSSDKSSKSVKRSTEISITNGKASNGNESSRGNISGRANSGMSVTEVESAHKGGSSSNVHESSRGNISGKANSGISVTEVESAHKGGSSSGSDGRREELNDKTSFKMSPNKTNISTGIISENSWNEGESNSPDTWGTSRRNPKVVSLAESVDVVDSPPPPSIGGDKMGDEGESNSPDTWGTSRRNPKVVSLAESVDVADSPPPSSIGGDKMGDDHTKLLMEFEQWLKVENGKLNRLCAEKSSCGGGGDAWRRALQMLKSRVPQGQKIFEGLLVCRPAMCVTEDLRLEDLRYRWMLYKSKLRDSGTRAGPNRSREPRDVTKKSGGLCSFLHRVCRAALPLQLLLLLLLLLAFLLPLVHETQNCALANNFARSFNLMLKYDGPPPT